jgi:hypothetical protein
MSSNNKEQNVLRLFYFISVLCRRDEQQQERCRVAARAALISSLPDELRRVIGNYKFIVT